MHPDRKFKADYPGLPGPTAFAVGSGGNPTSILPDASEHQLRGHMTLFTLYYDLRYETII